MQQQVFLQELGALSNTFCKFALNSPKFAIHSHLASAMSGNTIFMSGYLTKTFRLHADAKIKIHR